MMQFKPGNPRPQQGPSLSQMAAQGMTGGNDRSQYRGPQMGQQPSPSAAFYQGQQSGGMGQMQQGYGRPQQQLQPAPGGIGQMQGQARWDAIQAQYPQTRQLGQQRPGQMNAPGQQQGYGQMNAQPGRCPTCGK